jgi:hypothetical protein
MSRLYALAYPRIVSTALADFICKTITHVPCPCHQDTLAAGGACCPSEHRDQLLAMMTKFSNHHAHI